MLMAAQILLLGGLAVLLCVAALGDVRSYRISNRLNLLVAALAIPYWLVNFAGQWQAFSPLIWPQLGLIGIAFVILLALMTFNVLGGGDAKLLLALAFWFQPDTYLDMLMTTAIAGGALCLIILAQLQLNPPKTITGMNGDSVEAKRKTRIPYGVAIAVGGLIPISQLILNALVA
jgi:prepilin peptidase CpaA